MHNIFFLIENNTKYKPILIKLNNPRQTNIKFIWVLNPSYPFDPSPLTQTLPKTEN